MNNLSKEKALKIAYERNLITPEQKKAYEIALNRGLIKDEELDPEIKYAPPPEKTLREKIATGARAAQLGSIALPGLLGTPVSSVGRVVEGLAEGETTSQALKAGATSAAFDIATAGIGKYAKLGKQALKARKAKKGGISQTEFESAKDVLDRNKELFSGRKKYQHQNFLTLTI